MAYMSQLLRKKDHQKASLIQSNISNFMESHCFLSFSMIKWREILVSQDVDGLMLLLGLYFFTSTRQLFDPNSFISILRNIFKF